MPPGVQTGGRKLVAWPSSTSDSSVASIRGPRRPFSELYTVAALVVEAKPVSGGGSFRVRLTVTSVFFLQKNEIAMCIEVEIEDDCPLLSTSCIGVVIVMAEHRNGG